MRPKVGDVFQFVQNEDTTRFEIVTLVEDTMYWYLLYRNGHCKITLSTEPISTLQKGHGYWKICQAVYKNGKQIK